jgi:predicted nuclease of predicted toxin-antitoxin system
VRFLVDESLQRHVADLLVDNGHDAVHVSDIGLRGAPDETVLAAADADSRVLITADTDFGTLLALSGAAQPSVILLRRPGRQSAERAQIVLAILGLVSEALHRGAVITVETTRLRVRELPIKS